MPPPDAAPPSAHAMQDPSWRAFPPQFDSHPDSRRPSNASQGPLPPQGYPVMPNRELPQLPPEGPYSRPSSIPAPGYPPQDPNTNYRPSMSATPSETSPHSAPPDYRARVGGYAPDQAGNSDPAAAPGAIPSNPQYGPVVASMPGSVPGSYDPSYYGATPFGARQRKAARATQLEDRMEERMTQIHTITGDHSNLLTQLLMGHSPFPGLVKDRAVRSTPVTDPVMKPVAAPAEMVDNAFLHTNPMTGQVEEVKIDGDGELSIPVEHTTAAHKLLMWPGIKKLIWPNQYDEDYVMRLEEERGLINIWGQGETLDTADDSVPLRNLALGHTLSDPDIQTSSGPPDEAEDAEITENGYLNIDSETVRRYYWSYMSRMHILHPFLEIGPLAHTLEAFVRCHCTDYQRDGPRGAKRKRSNENMHGARGDTSTNTTSGRPRVGKNTENAILLLVLAIGAIAETDGPLRGPILKEKPDYRKEHIPGPPTPSSGGTHTTTNGILSPTNSVSTPVASAPMYTQGPQNTSHSFPSAINDGRQSSLRRSMSITRDSSGNTRNYQVIPGLALYGYAAVILGAVQGSSSLPHVHACILAGLYMGQLAHPFQSFGWIYVASRACQVLVRPKRYDKMEEGPLKDLYEFAYWTCLQLESDLLAELDVPASGISRSESRIPIPKGKWTLDIPNDYHSPASQMMMFYSAQIHLRKVLNRVHTDLYKVEKPGQNRWSSSVQGALSMNLDQWRRSLPKPLSWNDGDPPATDINNARMRAKYYGARYIIFRPLLYRALHYGASNVRLGSGPTSIDSPTIPQAQQMSPSVTYNQRAPEMARMASDAGARFASTWMPPQFNQRDLPYKLRNACKACIQSAIYSTEAFDGLPTRPVVTNIFGTAHAQFGNMLVLSATYMSCLQELVPKEKFEQLLKRTIRFLLANENISPSLRADARILTEIYHKIFGQPPQLGPVGYGA
ncbi:transcriptional regulator family: Fungal Specific TF [Penicillium lagena]|uniref:transcriptional regulator family: Fungal Specific TF n=1 Tax=Penicillium lagena TaxID=94218 RepID=UPI00253F687B|nr:transcriptional regulator family: Fungal Specific TF [Penicillium lagena]KAJ5605953.1 transcriptional regulator family: Fungal Specific TF [Penicillium lagena]